MAFLLAHGVIITSADTVNGVLRDIRDYLSTTSDCIRTSYYEDYREAYEDFNKTKNIIEIASRDIRKRHPFIYQDIHFVYIGHIDNEGFLEEEKFYYKPLFYEYGAKYL